jgi:hypothetical protein
MDDDTNRGPLDTLKQPAIATGVVIGALLCLTALLVVAWDLFVSPVWGMQPLTFGEGFGASLLVGLWVAVTYMLREDSSDD